MNDLKKNRWIIPVVAVVFLLILLRGTYNTLFLLDTDVDAAWAQVEGQYQRRADLIPNLVATVKGLGAQEQDLFIWVTEARAAATQTNVNIDDPASMEAFSAAQWEVSSALSRLLVTVENYPELKSNKAFEDLMVQIEGTENRISVERGRYNEAVKVYEQTRRSLRHVFFSKILFGDKWFYQAEEWSEIAPVVDFE